MVPGGGSGVTVTAIFTPAVTFVASGSTAGCAANSASGDPGTTVICPAAGSTVTINVTPQTVGTLNVVAGVIGTDFDPTMTNNSASAATAVASGAPVISNVTPASGPASGGYTAVITGSNLSGATSVTFGGVGASFTVANSSQINATVPAGSAGPATVSVATPLGTGNYTGFSYLASSKFYALAPCRVLDTRNATGPYGGPALSGSAARSFTISGRCGVPTGARAIVANLTAVGPTSAGTIVVYPSSSPIPLAGGVSYAAGQTIASLATVLLDSNGALSAYPYQASGSTVNLILDVSGYYQ